MSKVVICKLLGLVKIWLEIIVKDFWKWCLGSSKLNLKSLYGEITWSLAILQNNDDAMVFR